MKIRCAWVSCKAHTFVPLQTRHPSMSTSHWQLKSQNRMTVTQNTHATNMQSCKPISHRHTHTHTDTHTHTHTHKGCCETVNENWRKRQKNNNKNREKWQRRVVWIPYNLAWFWMMRREMKNSLFLVIKHSHHSVKGRGLLLYIKMTYKIETCVSLKSAVILSSCFICMKSKPGVSVMWLL